MTGTLEVKRVIVSLTNEVQAFQHLPYSCIEYDIVFFGSKVIIIIDGVEVYKDSYYAVASISNAEAVLKYYLNDKK